MSKQSLGQFFTSNYQYILQGFNIPNTVNRIIEPFAGNGDLLPFINTSDIPIICYDIEPKQDYIIQRDTLLDPPDYTGAYIITNPPYLARNKCNDKKVFDIYDTNDLYKCFIQILINSDCAGGILIVPLNFISSIRKNDIKLRQDFISKYNILHLNIFEERVFVDTSYTVCSFQFIPRNEISDDYNTQCTIFPSKRTTLFILNKDNNYTFGGEMYNLTQNTCYKIDRATSKNKHAYISNILLKCIDDSIDNTIKLSIVDDETKLQYIDNTPKLSARSYAMLIIEPPISIKKQEELVDKFNIFLSNKRKLYNSLFLSNYRDSNTIARKRISFNLAYNICNYLLDS